MVALSRLSFHGFVPLWLAPTLALLVLLTAAAVEEYFVAYDRHSVFGEAFFLTISVVSLVAQFWLRSMRGLLIRALTPADIGPVTHALKRRAVYFLLTVNRNVAVPVPALLVALSVTFELPMVVGLPEIRPVAAFTTSPAGRPVAPKLMGLLVAVI